MATSQRQQRRSDTKQSSTKAEKTKSNSNSNILILEIDDGNMSSSVFDSPCSSVTSDKHDVVIIVNDDSDIEIEEELNITTLNGNFMIKNLIGKLAINTELIVIKPNLPIRKCRTAVDYPKLQDIHIITVHNPQMLTPEYITKRQLYLIETYSSLDLPIRTRIFHHATSLLGFILETPCARKNNNRYLVLYDNFTAYYHTHSELHLCLCQDYRRHLSNIDYKELQLHYQNAFENINKSTSSIYKLNSIIRVRKFGSQYHNARIIDIDCSLIKICFFERKSNPEIWIHAKSSIIDQSQPVLQQEQEQEQPSIFSILSIPETPPEEIVPTYSDLSRLRKRKNDDFDINNDLHLDKLILFGNKKLHDRSNTRLAASSSLTQQEQPSLSSNEKNPSKSRNKMVTTYYTNILLPKFRVLNALPSTMHTCCQQCVLSAEEKFSSNKIQTNPFLLPFECHWSIVESKPRGYRTPCRRTLYSLDEIEQYLYRTQSKLSIKYFVDGVLTRFQPPIDNHSEKYIQLNDLSQGQENVQISVYNDIDNEKLDKFIYITKIRPIDNRISAAFNDTNMTSCCDCTDNCNDRMKCACFLKTLTQAQINQDPLVLEKEKGRYTQSNLLKTTSYQRKRLLNPISSGIYECNSKCSCHREHCSNRLVQQGLFVHIQLFKDKSKGWGLRTLHDLPRGTFVCQYIGELLTSDQGHERAQIMDDKYQTSLDLVKLVRYEITDEDNIDDSDDDDGEPYVIDGSLYSNVGKYFNHSCDPNMFIQNVFIESHDLHFPNLALFTRTHIKAGQELTWHYNCELLPDREQQNSTRLNNKTFVLSSVAIQANASLSSSQTTDDSSTVQQSDTSTNKTHLIQRMISLKRSTKNKSLVYRSYNLRAFEIAHDHYSIIIHFLDDTERTFYVDRQCKGIVLLNEIFDYLDLSNEKKYFGLLIEDLTQDFAYRWLDSTKTLKKQLTTNIGSYHLYFKVRFFVTDPWIQIDDEFTKYLYVLQLKKELLSGKIWCPRTLATILASYVVQSELGDYDINEHQSGYLNDFRFVPFQNSDFESEVQQYHKQHRGQSPADAENNYLRVASSLDMYGVELHKASVKVSNTNDKLHNSKVELYIGVCASGISVFQNSTKANTFLWDQITKISFKRRTFYVQLIKNPDSSDDNSIVFTLRNYRCCKYLWKSCVDHHTFFRLTSVPSSSKKFFPFTSKLRHRLNTDIVPNTLLMETNERREKKFQRISSRRSSRSGNNSSTLPITSMTNNFSIIKNSNLSLSSSNLSIPKFDKPLSPPPKPPRQSYKSSLTNSALIEANEYKPKNATLPRENFQNLLSNSSSMSCVNTNSILIKLTPDVDGRYGFNIKGGEDEQTPTVVSKVAYNTPASRASIHEGDIILAINNIDIRNHTHEEIINMIRYSRERPFGELELVIKSKDENNSLENSLQILRSDLTTNRLTEQYETLERRKNGFTFEISSNQTNYYYNRYKDVLPYDQTRVILKNNIENDYINANYINMPIISTDIVNRYIATQGPLPTTCEAFWQMIWEQECTLIIMLTTLFESGRIKCHQYWPNVSETNDYGLFTIRCTRERKENELMYREFIFLNKEINEERIIYQIQNEIWPDHGVPNDYVSFVDFVLEIRELRKANKHLPILVHCSAGIGRTGVLILMETALCLMENNQSVFPLNIVRLMREQRLGMIQTASQYQFACEAVLYAYDHGLIEINGN
ncbi:unnamed protein product [Adineta steineri]|uniref:protein-tyrosine-phosphatase n=1 Tax=Adineta steineri TaxID=433720 RepID=A0A818QX16_9BILA|nr:unnamed protein product [Adineta steineri]